MSGKNKIIIIATVAVLVAIGVYLKYIRMKIESILNGTDSASNNVKAFLSMIRKCEHGKDTPEVYYTVFGGEKIKSLSNHPAITGEWTGKTLSDAMCRNAGFGPGCKSTAAGAYQYIKNTWKAKALKLGLNDFSEKSQDTAAIDDLRSFGLLGLIESGRITEALSSKRLGQQWASLPTATTKQNPKSQATALGYYKSAGGTVTV